MKSSTFPYGIYSVQWLLLPCRGQECSTEGFTFILPFSCRPSVPFSDCKTHPNSLRMNRTDQLAQSCQTGQGLEQPDLVEGVPTHSSVYI